MSGKNTAVFRIYRDAVVLAGGLPLARFIMAITSAFLLARSAFGLLAGFSGLSGLLRRLGSLGRARLLFGCDTSGDAPFFSDSNRGVHSFLLTGLR
jgi:hypothetical protein